MIYSVFMRSDFSVFAPIAIFLPVLFTYWLSLHNGSAFILYRALCNLRDCCNQSLVFATRHTVIQCKCAHLLLSFLRFWRFSYPTHYTYSHRNCDIASEFKYLFRSAR